MMEQFGSEEVMNEYNPKFQKIIELITKDYSVIVFLKICVFVLDFQHIFVKILLFVSNVSIKFIKIRNFFMINNNFKSHKLIPIIIMTE